MGELEEELLLETVRSTWISSNGKYIPQFEKEFSAYCGSKFGVSTSNGTTALHLAVHALGIGPGDEVIVPAYTGGEKTVEWEIDLTGAKKSGAVEKKE